MSHEPLTVSATLVRRETYAPAWGVLLKPVERLVSVLPAYRDSKQGRRNANQLRVGLLVAGMAVMLFGAILPWILVGALVMIAALVLPLSEITKSAWRSRLYRLRTRRERDARTPGELAYDGKRLILRQSDDTGFKKLRRVLVDRGQHTVELRRRDHQRCLGVRPASARKAESIWICATAAPDSEQVDEIVQEIGEDDVDIWAHVAPNDWETIYDLLNG